MCWLLCVTKSVRLAVLSQHLETLWIASAPTSTRAVLLSAESVRSHSHIIILMDDKAVGGFHVRDRAVPSNRWDKNKSGTDLYAFLPGIGIPKKKAKIHSGPGIRFGKQ